MVELKQCLIEKDGEAPYARVIIQHQGVLVLVEIVQTALRYPILNLNATLDVLLVRKLHLVLCLIPFLTRRASIHHSLIIFPIFSCCLVVSLTDHMLRLVVHFIEWQSVIVCTARVQLRVGSDKFVLLILILLCRCSELGKTGIARDRVLADDYICISDSFTIVR